MKYLLLFLIPFTSYAIEPIRYATAKIQITRSYFTLNEAGNPGDILDEVVCEKEELIPVFDARFAPELRASEKPATIVCETKYRNEKMNVIMRGRLELLKSEVFGLNLPKGTEVKRTYFTLYADVGAGFPYLNEIQYTSGWQFFTQSLNLDSQIFAITPGISLAATCNQGKCTIDGPQSIYRASVILQDNLK